MSDSDEQEIVVLLCENTRFIISKENALISGYIRSILYNRESDIDSDINIDFISLNTFKYIIEYMEYRNGIDLQISNSSIKDGETLLDYVDQENIDYLNDISDTNIINILTASCNDKLNIQGLRKLTTLKLAFTIKSKSKEEAINFIESHSVDHNITE